MRSPMRCQREGYLAQRCDFFIQVTQRRLELSAITLVVGVCEVFEDSCSRRLQPLKLALPLNLLRRRLREPPFLTLESTFYLRFH